MRKALVAIALIAVFANPRLASAQQAIDTEQAQSQMWSRVIEAAKAYAQSIGIEESWIGYCQEELHLQTYAHPPDGYVPFGVNYDKITDRKRLDEILLVRQTYTTSFITLCLANVKKTLADARR